MKFKQALLLMRFHKPVGIWLLWFPVAWSLWVANRGMPDISILFYFFTGTVLMRAAGCVLNDIADRNIDKHVSRTKLRPLTSGSFGLIESFALLILLLSLALVILLQLPRVCFYYALLAVCMTALYPFCKRFMQAPQLVLGIAFSVGIPMAFAASGKHINELVLSLVLINILWVITYDTMYALADREDDLLIGVKSTAILFAPYEALVIGTLQVTLHFIWLFMALRIHLIWIFYLLWFGAGILFVYQQHLLQLGGSENYIKAFKNNVYYGLLMWIAISI